MSLSSTRYIGQVHMFPCMHCICLGECVENDNVDSTESDVSTCCNDAVLFTGYHSQNATPSSVGWMNGS